MILTGFARILARTALFFFLPAALHAGVRTFRCKAVDPGNKAVIFTCSGWQEIQAGMPVAAEIRYSLRGGKLLAKENIDYRTDKNAPDVTFTDYRDGRRENIQKSAQGFRLTTQSAAKAPPETQTLDHTNTDFEALTIPGLPQFFEQHWNKLNGSEKTVFYCVFPIQKKLLRMRAQFDRRTTHGRAEAVIFRLQPDNFVYRWFSEPVYLTFLLKTRKLVRYQGLHYIRDPRTGGGSIVDLTFSW